MQVAELTLSSPMDVGVGELGVEGRIDGVQVAGGRECSVSGLDLA